MLAVAARSASVGEAVAELAGELLVRRLEGLSGLLEERGHPLDALHRHVRAEVRGGRKMPRTHKLTVSDASIIELA